MAAPTSSISMTPPNDLNSIPPTMTTPTATAVLSSSTIANASSTISASATTTTAVVATKKKYRRRGKPYVRLTTPNRDITNKGQDYKNNNNNNNDAIERSIKVNESCSLIKRVAITIIGYCCRWLNILDYQSLSSTTRIMSYICHHPQHSLPTLGLIRLCNWRTTNRLLLLSSSNVFRNQLTMLDIQEYERIPSKNILLLSSFPNLRYLRCSRPHLIPTKLLSQLNHLHVPTLR
jgi:hypothetical protein